MTAYRVLVVQPLHPDGFRLLDERQDVTYEVLETADPDRMRRLAPDLDAITIRDARLPADVVEAAPRLRVVSRHGVGYDNVPVDTCTARGVPVAIVGAVNTVAVAEHTVFLLLAAARGGIRLDAAVRAGDFAIRSRTTAVELAGRTLLLVGVGRIGRAVAERVSGFGMRVIGYDPFLHGAAPPEIEMVDDLDAGLRRADAVSLHVPLTDTTAHLLDERALGLLPTGAIVVNTARGGLLDEAALLDAVRAGRLHGAGLDVFVDEPLPDTSPLLDERRIVLTPHAAALTGDALRAMSTTTVRNVFAGLDGCLDPALVVNPEVLPAGTSGDRHQNGEP
jgi:D-3-phosphoglycerate dehydrogenase